MGFKGFIAKRVLISVPTFFIASLIVFFLVHSAPGDPILTLYGLQPDTDFDREQLDYMRHLYGLDQPIIVQYFHWISRVIRFDLGRSYVYRSPVSELVAKAILNTLKLQLTGTVLAILIAIPIGVISAVKQYSKIDYTLMTGSLLLWSLPWFWYGLMLILVFSVTLGWLPSHGTSYSGGFFDELRHMILPVAVLATATLGFLARIVRSSMLEVLRQDYIVVARAKGLRERIVIYKHALRNALLPVVTVIGLYFGFVLSGAAIIETTFAWPGCGWLIVQASTFRDYTLLMGITMVVTLSVIISVLITDITYGYLDPRIKY